MAVIAPSVAGAPVTYAAASGGGDSFANSGRERLHVRNGGGAPITVTIVATGACTLPGGGTGFLHDQQFTIANGSDKILPAFSVDRHGTSVSVTYSAVTSVTVGVVA